MNYPAIRVEGQIFSGELLQRLDQPDTSGQRPVDFGLLPDVKVKDEIARAWAASQSYYRAFRAKIAGTESSSFTTETRNLWLIPFLSLLGYKPEFARKGEEIHGKTYPISHRDDTRDGLPMHLLGWNDSLDKRREDGSGPRMSPHALVQEYLNLTEHLYALVSNGRTLRLLRDSTRLVRQSFIEFDLERMFDEDLFADFAVIFRLLHASRLPASQSDASTSLVEKYHQDALEQGSRIRDGLSKAVKQAILGFANGFLSHPDNDALLTEIAAGRLTPGTYYQHLLRLIYRFLFLLVTEERRLIFPPSVSARNRDIYYRHYSLQRIRRLAEKPHLIERRHKDLWMAVMATFRLFEADGPGQKLDVAPLAGDLFSPDAIGPLNQCGLDNGTVLDCLRALSLYQNPDTRQTIRVNYGALNVEEFGSVYQELLEHEPVFSSAEKGIIFSFVQGDERSRTGSHYTPDELVQPLIRHSLDYLIADKLKEKDKEKALLSLRVADISCGSGHILLAAARRIATELAIVRTGEEQPSPAAFRAAVRDVIRECIYGVDINPLAVELCKVALWLEAHNPGQPLNFLDHHIKCGDAIVGYASREEVERGIPDEAFTTLPGDDKETAAEFRKRNKADRKDYERKQEKLDFSPEVQKQLAAVLVHSREISGLSEKTPDEIAAKKKRYEEFTSTADAYLLKQILSIPIAQFYIPKTVDNRGKLIADADFRLYWTGQRHPKGQATAMAAATAGTKHFFHWFLEFPEIIERGGFDCILGNPPFLGNRELKSQLGERFMNWVRFEFAPAGSVDLVTYFYRRVFALLKPSGFQALIATKTIYQGNAREGGLDVIVEQGGAICFAVRTIRWPGQATVDVALIALFKGKWSRSSFLDGKPVNHITTYLDTADVANDPEPLFVNEDKSFQGTIVLGEGFVLDPQEARQLIQRNPKNKDVIFPFVIGDDLNTKPDQSASNYVINFFDWSEEKARVYTDCYRILDERVKPERTRLDEQGNYVLRKPLPQRWWLYADKRPKLYSTIAGLKRVLVGVRISKYLNLLFLNNGQVFNDKVIATAFGDYRYFAMLQSCVHEAWAWKYCGTLGSTTLIYSPSKCFVTFPFPSSLSALVESELEQIGERYHEHRRELMLKLQLGLTKIYNLFHTRDLTPDKVAKISKKSPAEAQAGYDGILELRRLHVQLDIAIRDAYGWQDLDLGHDFHEVETLPENDRVRYTISPTARKELLKRILALNQQRHAEEVASQLCKNDRVRRKQSGRNETREDRRSSSGTPDIVLPSELRLPAANPATYLMQFVLLAIQESKGSIRLMDLARAYVLLRHRSIITDLTREVGEMHNVAGKWAQIFNEEIDETQFAESLKYMSTQRKEIALHGEGRDVTVTTTVFAELPDNIPGWRRIDAQLTCWAVRRLPPAIFDQAKIAKVVEKMIQQAVA